MSAHDAPRAVPLADDRRRRPPVRAWTAVTAILSWAIFAQAVFAGFLLSADDWGQTAHRTNANLLSLASLLVAILAAVQLRGRPQHRRMTIMLFALAVGIFVQHRTGIMASEGDDVLWLHVPLGVALAGFAAQTMLVARTIE